ncbi:thrombospondin type 3 repeat-containing protein [Akkermansiaceae bacterium]|nr:thrombospondin type 3 repeat-containing protein [Akkermansiaceae bacterium]
MRSGLLLLPVYSILPLVFTESKVSAVELDPSFGAAGILTIPATTYWSNLTGVHANQDITLLYGIEGGGSPSNGNVFIKKFNSEGAIDSSFGIDGHFASDISNTNVTQSSTVAIYDVRDFGDETRLLFSTYSPFRRNIITRLTPSGVERFGPFQNEGINDWDGFYQSGGFLSDQRVWLINSETNEFGVSNPEGYPIQSFGNNGFVDAKVYINAEKKGRHIELASGRILIGRNLFTSDGDTIDSFDLSLFFEEVWTLIGAQDGLIANTDAYELPNGNIRILGYHQVGNGFDGNSTFISEVSPNGRMVTEGRYRFIKIDNTPLRGYRQEFLPNGSVVQLRNRRSQIPTIEVIDPLANSRSETFATDGLYSGFDLSGNNIFSWSTTSTGSNDKDFVVSKFILEDTDKDGLEDATEIALGTAVDSLDSDEDGITDWEEVVRLDLDPLNSDTDGDGASDGFEIDAGFDPKDSNSKPAGVIDIRPAVEISIYASIGTEYSLQYSADMETWIDSGVTVTGTGEVQTFLRSTADQRSKYWRVREIQ